MDRIIEFKYASKMQAKRLFNRFYPEEPDLAEKLVEILPDQALSMAQLQGTIFDLPSVDILHVNILFCRSFLAQQN